MLEAAVFGLLVVFPLLGVLTRRWLVVALPFIVWPVFYIGLNRGWWLYGTGDGWEISARFFTVLGTLTTAAAVAIARAVKLPRKSNQFRLARPT